MVRGTTLFTCDECNHIFKALDIEYACTTLSMPQPCPKCGSYHTLPGLHNTIPAVRKLDPYYGIYRQLWEDIDKNRNNNSNK